MRLPPIWESGSVWTLWMSEDKMKALWMCLDSCTPCTNTNTMWSFSFWPLRPFEQCFQMTSTYINSISRVKTRKLSIRFCEWICQFPTLRRRYCFDILATRMTWRYISHNSLLSGLSFTFQQPPLTCHVSWQRGQRASAFLRWASAASCIETVAPVDKLCV